MAKVMLITGSSSGIGKATALVFANKGWTVVATMRKPEVVTDLDNIPGLIKLPLDVTDEQSVTQAVQETITRFGGIDVLVNNAGYGLLGPLEALSYDQMNLQYQTNVLGLMRVTQAVVPHMREKGTGTIINISSMLGRITLPYMSLYTSTKWAVEGFTESLAFELEPFGITVRLVEPGSIKTNFFTANIVPNADKLGTYAQTFNNVMKSIDDRGQHGAAPEKVALTIWKAANSPSRRLRYTVDNASRLLIAVHSIMPPALYRRAIRHSIK